MKHTRIYKTNLVSLFQVIVITIINSLITPNILSTITKNPTNIWSFVISFFWIAAIVTLASGWNKSFGDFVHISHYESDLQWRKNRLRLEELISKEARTPEENDELRNLPLDVWRV